MIVILPENKGSVSLIPYFFPYFFCEKKIAKKHKKNFVP